MRIDDRVCSDPDAEFPTAGLEFEVRGQCWPYRSPALVVMHKPSGYECSQKPKHHPSVYTLLPEPLRRRNVQAIGRLDEDTTGLLLFTDDGQLIHRWTSPKHELPKVYEVRCKHAVTTGNGTEDGWQGNKVCNVCMALILPRGTCQIHLPRDGQETKTCVTADALK